MFVNNVRLYAKHLRRDLVVGGDALPEAARRRLLLQGANGSGKSTFLEVITALWDFFGEWIDLGPGRKHNSQMRSVQHHLARADIAAVEIGGLLPQDQSLWIGQGNIRDWVDLKDQHPEAQFAGFVKIKEGSWEIQLPERDWTTFRQKSLVESEPQPNVVFFPPENRTVPLRASQTPRIIDLMPYHWLASYNSQVDLGSLLLTIRARSENSYEASVRLINQALDNQRKELVGFGPKGLIVRGSTESGGQYEHPIGALSSGEKQMLLLIGFLSSTLRPGGIVVIDEPDLHIHTVMVQQLLGAIETIVKERRGQVIVASHSPEVWDWFSLESERIELTPWRRSPA